FMLAGMAVEVLLKSIMVHDPAVRQIVTSKPKTLSPTQRVLRDAFYSHRLADIARAARVRLTSKQRKTAVGLSQFVYWRGRYVVPTEAGILDLVPIPQDDGLIGPSHGHVTIALTCDLVGRVVRAVKISL